MKKQFNQYIFCQRQEPRKPRDAWLLSKRQGTAPTKTTSEEVVSIQAFDTGNPEGLPPAQIN